MEIKIGRTYIYRPSMAMHHAGADRGPGFINGRDLQDRDLNGKKVIVTASYEMGPNKFWYTGRFIEPINKYEEHYTFVPECLIPTQITSFIVKKPKNKPRKI